jgi:serine/threonine protein kinase
MTPMPVLKCPQCARELAAGADTCPFDGTPINSVIARFSLWQDDTTDTKKVDRPGRAGLSQGEAPELLTGQKLGDYQVGALLGQGGMGEVYAGEQPMIGKKVAIKVLKAEVAAEPGNVQRMLSEARSVNAIRHRSIVDIFNFGTLPDGRPYLVMEYLEGTALDAMLRKQGALIPAEVAEFLEEICSALAAAHGRGIVHRDLKPGNVFIVSDGNTRNRYLKLLDFGLAKGEASSDAIKTRAGMVVGTPDYIAPEQARGGTISPRTDLYSLGVMAFEMLTGALPFVADSVVELMMMHVQAPAPRVSSRLDFCPPALDALVYQLMSKAPEDRPRSAEGVRQDLARIRREMRESETMVGQSSIPNPPQTVQIRAPEADTPTHTPTFPAASPRRPRVSRGLGPRTPSAVVVDPTARYASVPGREPPAGRVKVVGLVVALSAALAGGAYVILQNRPAGTIEVPLPPPDSSRPVVEALKLTTHPEAAIVPVAKPSPTPKVPASPKPKVAPKPAAVPTGPSKEALRADLAKLLSRLETVNQATPTEIKRVEDRFSGAIDAATTADERQKVADDLSQIP